MTVTQIAELLELPDSTARRALHIACADGLLHRDGHAIANRQGNKSSLYRRTAVPIDDEGRYIPHDFAPYRHWQDEALFGPHARAA